MKEVKSKKYNGLHLLILGVISLSGIVIVLISTHKYGAGASPDSVNYVAAARSLLAGKGFLRFNGVIYDTWPPFYSILLASLKLCGIDYLISARCISAMSLGLLIFLASLWVLRYSNSLFLAVLCSISILFSKPLFHISCYAWTEALFITLITAFFFALNSTLKNPNFKTGFVLALITAAVCLTRYVGVALIPIGVLLFLINKKQLFWKRAMFAISWTVGSILPLSLWLLRNRLLTGAVMGSGRAPADTTFFENVALAGKVIAGWFLPHQIVQSVPGGISFCVFFVLIAVVLASIISNSRKYNRYWLDSPLIPVLLFLVLYTLGILISVSRVKVDALNDRLLSPLYVPAVLLFFGGIKNMFALGLKATTDRKEIRSTIIQKALLAGIGVGVWFGMGANFVLSRAQNAFQYGAGGFNHSRWQKSETISWLKTHHLEGRLFSNNICPLYFLTDHLAETTPIVSSYFDNSPARVKESKRQLSNFISAVNSGDKAYIVWLSLRSRKHLSAPDQLSKYCQIKTVKKFRDGAVFALFPK